MKKADGDRELLEKDREEGFKLRPLRFEDFFAQDAATMSIPGLHEHSRVFDFSSGEADLD